MMHFLYENSVDIYSVCVCIYIYKPNNKTTVSIQKYELSIVLYLKT